MPSIPEVLPLCRWDTQQVQFSAGHLVSSVPAKLPNANPTKSFWIDSSPDANPLASEGSDGSLTDEADICIIGAGITGVGAAYHLSQLSENLDGGKPLRVVILEARDFCSGATGRNGGHLTPVAFLDFQRWASQFGTDEAIRSIALEAHTASSLVSIAHSHNLVDKVDLVQGGHIDLFFTEKEVSEARADFDAAKMAGVDLSLVEWYEKEQIQARYGTDYPAVRIPGHNLWPLKLVTQLYHLSQERNGPKFQLAIHTRTPVIAISSRSEGPLPYTVTTPRGPIACSRIIHANNAYASHLLPFLAGPEGIVPTRGQIIATPAAVSSRQIGTNGWGGNEGFEYWFPRPISGAASGVLEKPLIILGGGREATQLNFEFYEEDDSVLDPEVGHILRDFLPTVFPGKFQEDKEPDMEWTGIMGFTKMGDPFVGPVIDPSSPTSDVYKGQYISAGYSGHGMPRAFGCAEIVAQMIIAEMSGKDWSSPSWLPQRFLTWNRIKK